MENVVRTEGWAGAAKRTNRSKERSKGMEFLKGTILCNCGDMGEDGGNNGANTRFTPLLSWCRILFDPESR
jgi:hypothetical protein